MKTIVLPKALFRLLVGVLLTGMAIFAWLTYVQYTQSDAVVLPSRIGTLAVDADWRVRLKDNPFYPTNELSSDYAYVSSLVDQLIIDLDFHFKDGIEGEAAVLNCQVDGVLQATYGASNNSVLLLEQKYPNLKSVTAEDAGPSFQCQESLELSLAPYNYVIDSFQSAYQVSVTAQLQLKVMVTLGLESQGETVEKDVQLDLTIPLGNTVFQISGTPSVTLDLFSPTKASSGEKTASRTIEFLIFTAGFAILTLLCYLFLEPRKPDEHTALVNLTIQQAKSRMAAVTTNPRNDKLQLIAVPSIKDLIAIADESIQPILYFHSDGEHSFFVLSAETLYMYSILPSQSARSEEESTPNNDVSGKGAPPLPVSRA